MNLRKWIWSFILFVFAVMPLNALIAQDAEPERIVCDSTLATLLLIAEHDYQYLSGKMNPDTMDDPALSIDLGALQPIAEQFFMMAMRADNDADVEMSEEARAASDAMRAETMGMNAPDAVNAYLTGMNMMVATPFTELAAGSVVDEAPECATVRADVEQFILAHLLTDLRMMNAQGG